MFVDNVNSSTASAQDRRCALLAAAQFLGNGNMLKAPRPPEEHARKVLTVADLFLSWLQ